MVAKAAPPTMEAALKKIVKRDAALSIVPVIQIAGDAESDEEDAGDAAAGAAPAGAAAPAAPPAPPAAPKAPAAPGVLGIQKALQKLGFDPGTIDGVDGPKTQAAIKKFQQANGLAADGVAGAKTQAALAKALAGGGGAGGGPAAPPTPPPATGPAKSPPTPAAKLNLGPWQAARQTAINDLKALAAKVAATKHGTAADVLKEIQSIIARLPASPAPKDIDKLEDFVRKDETITAAEKVPSHFHDLNIREPLLKALETLKQ
jgi:hypothetical protein